MIDRIELIQIMEDLISSAKDDEFQYGATDFSDFIKRAEEIVEELKKGDVIG